MAFYYSYDTDIQNLINKCDLTATEHELLYEPEKLHNTMFYSHENYEKEFSKILLPDVSVKIIDVVVWNNPDNNYLVVLLEPHLLTQYHEIIKTELKNIQHSHSSFNPHITLQRNKKDNRILSPEKFKGLIGESVRLSKFRCIEHQVKPNSTNVKPGF